MRKFLSAARPTRLATLVLAALTLFAATSLDVRAAQTTNVSRSQALVDIEVDLVVEAAAYGAGDLVADKVTITNAVEIAGGGVEIRAVFLFDQAAQDVDYDLVFFNADPTGTTFTKNSALDVADADLDKIVGWVNVDTFATFADNAILRGEPDLPLVFVIPSGTSLYAALITRGTPTYAATTDVKLRLVIERR